MPGFCPFKSVMQQTSMIIIMVRFLEKLSFQNMTNLDQRFLFFFGILKALRRHLSVACVALHFSFPSFITSINIIFVNVVIIIVTTSLILGGFSTALIFHDHRSRKDLSSLLSRRCFTQSLTSPLSNRPTSHRLKSSAPPPCSHRSILFVF